MKKIGVITFNRSINYGAFFQAFALQKTLKTLNINASVIDYENIVDKKRYAIINRRSLKSLAKSIAYLPISVMRKKNFSKAQKKLKYSSVLDEYDVAIAGSDQIWNPKLTGGRIDKNFFLKGINARKKISYAASVGNASHIEEYRSDYVDLIAKLDHISVRESQTRRALKTMTNKDIKVTIDPTGLIPKAEWEEIISSIKIDKNPYIFSYFIGARKDQIIALAKISEKLGLKVTSYSQIPKEKRIYKYCYTDGPFEFLARLRDAKLVVTSSFHGTILSIIFHKNFYVLMPAKEKRERMDNILKLTGLENRIIETEADLDEIDLKNIDYTEPQKKLDALREDSLEWLKKAIGE